MKYYHPEDKSLSFLMRSNPCFNNETMNRTHVYIDTGLKDLIEQLVTYAAQPEYKDCSICTDEDSVILIAPKSALQLETERLEFEQKYSDWKKLYDHNMQVLQEAYEMKVQMQSKLEEIK